MANVALPLTYPDLVCVLDLDPYAAETTSDLQNLIQDVLHILREHLGSNPDDPERGCGVENYLSGTVDQFRTLCGTIETQLNTDERISSTSATITANDDSTFLLRIEIGVSGTIIPLEYGWQNGNFTNLTG